MGKRRYKVKEIADALDKAGGFVTHAAKMLGCNYNTVQNYINRYKELQLKQKEIDERYIDIAVSKLIQNVQSGQEASIFFFLKCKGKHRGYIEKADQEPAQINISFNVQVAKILERCEAKGINPEKVQLVRDMMMQLGDGRK